MLDTRSGHKKCLQEGVQEVVTRSVYKKWSQEVVTGSGLKKWSQEVVTRRGHKSIGQLISP